MTDKGQVSGFGRVVDACHSGLVDDIEVLDRELENTTGISSITNTLLLEVLATVAIVVQNFELAKALVVKGPPPPRSKTPYVWVFREDSQTLPLELLALLLRKHWLFPLDISCVPGHGHQ